MTAPTSITVTTAPWGGTYTTTDTGPGLWSYYGPVQNSEFKDPSSLRRWKIPTVHFSLKPNAARPYEPHVSIEVATSATSIKNLHLYHNTGNRQWSPTGDFTTDQLALVAAVQAQYPNAIETMLDEVVAQLQSGVAPVYVPPVAGPTAGPTIDTGSEDQFPSLTRENQQRGQGGARGARSNRPLVQPVEPVAPVVEPLAPVASTTPAHESETDETQTYETQTYETQTNETQTYETQAYAAQAYDPQAYDPQAYAQPDPQYDPNAPSANDPVYEPTGAPGQYGAVGWDPNAPSSQDPVYEPAGYQANWGAVGDAVTPTAQADPFPADGYYTFVVSDGRRLRITEANLVQAVALTGLTAGQGAPINIAWNGEWITVTDDVFEPA